MLPAFVALGVVSVFPTTGSSAQDIRQLWWVDKETVMVGGCATIILDEACRKMGGLTLAIDDRRPIPLLERAGITIQYTTGPGPGITHTFVLISHDFANPEGCELIAQDPVTYRMVPVFNEPRPVRLTIESDHGSLGSSVVNVVPATPEAEAAVELLYPVIVRKNGASAQNGRVVELLARAASGGGPGVSRKHLEELYEDLVILEKHPDWAEIFKMLVTRVEARIRVKEFSDVLKTNGNAPEKALERSAVSERVQEAMQADVKSPFAKAIQNSLKSAVALPKILAQRSGASAAGAD